MGADLSSLASESAPVNSTWISFGPETDTWNCPEVILLGPILGPHESFPLDQ